MQVINPWLSLCQQCIFGFDDCKMVCGLWYVEAVSPDDLYWTPLAMPLPPILPSPSYIPSPWRTLVPHLLHHPSLTHITPHPIHRLTTPKAPYEGTNNNDVCPCGTGAISATSRPCRRIPWPTSRTFRALGCARLAARRSRRDRP